mmetsp:Transcript_58735/g.137061  ORF Transcript_58735/g.137061 Transcript_58735/m.137061 type:complete len:780 (-) Transcript_58735:13-2352(-)
MPPYDAQVQSSAICAVVSTADRVFGFATFDEEQRKLRLCEYREDRLLSRTEALLLQVHPQSCCVLLPPETEECKKMERVAESCGVAMKEVKKEDLKQVDIEQDLQRLLADASGCGLSRHLEEQRHKQGMKALGALLAHYQLLSEPSNFAACTLSMYPLQSVMRLDKAAFSALNILPRPDENLRSNATLFGFLNRCRSTIGTRCLRQWLSQPLTSPEEIAARHDVVEAFVRDNELLRQVEGSFRFVPDLERMAARLHRTNTKSKASKADLEDVITLYQCIRSVEPLAQVLSGYGAIHSARLQKVIVDPLVACLSDFKGFKALVEQTMDLKQAEHRTYCVSMNFDDALRQIGAQRDHFREQMETLRAAVDKELDIQGRTKNEKGVSLVDWSEGQAFRVTKKNQQIVMNAKSAKYSFKALSIKKQELVFTVPQLEKLNAQLKNVLTTYDRQSSQLAEKALKIAATYCPVVERIGTVLATLDVLGAFARAALNAPCDFVRPTLDLEGKTFDIKGAAHVLVLANSDRAFVANDLHMARETSRLHIITGPNMGGKSTYIRSVALIALLNQIGCFVPCQEATLPVFDSVMCRVGASDMQLRGISTFMAEMLEAACILGTATERSLVIVDELGRGTSTSDGFGIAWAIAKHLTEQVRCFSLFATHFHELAVLADRSQAVTNRHATAAVDPASGRLTFLYSLSNGAADQSYGVHVAELAGFPDAVVEAARQRAVENEANAEFGRPAKRQRTHEATAVWDLLLSAADEAEFARRAIEQLPQLQAALAVC